MQPGTDRLATARPLDAPRGDDLAEGDVVLGRYALERVLGRGGAGTVWRATDRELRRRVAVKAMPAQMSDRTLVEARAAARLNHPAIVSVFGMGTAEGRSWLVQELVEGITLRRAIVEDTHTDDELLRIGAELCGAVRHAHERGVVHRDVTPRNVLLAADERATAAAKLADFGIARVRTGTEDEQGADAAPGRVVGTLTYMAPERLRGGRGDEAGDLWALGVVLHEALTGEHPGGAARPGRTASDLLPIHLDLPSLAPRRPDLEPALVAAIDRACLGDPAARGTVADLEAAVAAAHAARTAPAAREARSAASRGDERREATPRPPLSPLAGPAAAVGAAVPVVGLVLGAAVLAGVVVAGRRSAGRTRRVLGGVALLAASCVGWALAGTLLASAGAGPAALGGAGALPAVAWLATLVLMAVAFPRRLSGRPDAEGSVPPARPSRSIR